MWKSRALRIKSIREDSEQQVQQLTLKLKTSQKTLNDNTGKWNQAVNDARTECSERGLSGQEEAIARVVEFAKKKWTSTSVASKDVDTKPDTAVVMNLSAGQGEVVDVPFDMDPSPTNEDWSEWN